jgi:hypothetical protein
LSPPHRIFHKGTFQPSCCESPPSRPFFELREGTAGEEVLENEPKLPERDVEERA